MKSHERYMIPSIADVFLLHVEYYMSSSELDHVDLTIYSSPYGFRDFRTPRLILVSLSSFLTELKDATLKEKMEKKS